MIKVLIADDHKQVRDAWKMLLNRNEAISVVACCENGRDAIDVCKREQPDVVLMDINMAPVNGIEATEAITRYSDQIKVIGISVHTELPYISRMLKAGAHGYVTKSSSSDEMVTAIFAVSRGERYLCSELGSMDKQLL